MKATDRELILRILELLFAISSTSFRAVPVLFRPAGIQAKLEEIGALLEQVRKTDARR